MRMGLFSHEEFRDTADGLGGNASSGVFRVTVPEVCRHAIGVFVAQQEGELIALLAAEAEPAQHRPSLGQA